MLTVPEPLPPAAMPARGAFPPSARRRGKPARPTSELRQAVAGAVARAAAQGPLLGRDPEDAENGRPGSSASAATARAAEVPGEDLFGAAGEPASAVALPRRRSNRLSASPTASPPAVTEDTSPLAAVEAQAGPGPTGPGPGTVAEPEAVAATGTEPPAVVEPEAVAATGTELPAVVEASAPDGAVSEAQAGEPLPVAEVAELRSSEPAAKLHFPALGERGEPSWPIGERRSSARQARKPLPAALQAVVASDIAQSGLGEPAKPAASGQGPEPTDALLGTTGASAEADNEPGTGAKPGLLRRYASAIAIVVLFAAAGGAAAGVAALRGPVSRPGLPTAAQDKAAANRVVLKSGDFPSSWHVSTAGFSASSYGFGSVFATPAVLNAWLVTNPACATALEGVSAAVTASAGNTTAEAATQATSSGSLDGSWQTADVVAVHTSAAQLRNDLAAMGSLVADPSARACIDRYWSAALLAPMPAGSRLSLSVSQSAPPVLPGSPPAYVMSMGGTATVRGVTVPFRFEVTSFAVGREQVSFVSSSKLAPLPLNLDRSLLVVLATRAEQQAS